MGIRSVHVTPEVIERVSRLGIPSRKLASILFRHWLDLDEKERAQVIERYEEAARQDSQRLSALDMASRKKRVA